MQSVPIIELVKGERIYLALVSNFYKTLQQNLKESECQTFSVTSKLGSSVAHSMVF